MRPFCKLVSLLTFSVMAIISLSSCEKEMVQPTEAKEVIPNKVEELIPNKVEELKLSNEGDQTPTPPPPPPGG